MNVRLAQISSLFFVRARNQGGSRPQPLPWNTAAYEIPEAKIRQSASGPKSGSTRWRPCGSGASALAENSRLPKTSGQTCHSQFCRRLAGPAMSRSCRSCTSTVRSAACRAKQTRCTVKPDRIIKWYRTRTRASAAPRYLRLTAIMITCCSASPVEDEPWPRSVSITVTAKPLRASAPANLSS